MPRWSRGDSVFVHAEAQESGSLANVRGVSFTFGLFLRMGSVCEC